MHGEVCQLMCSAGYSMVGQQPRCVAGLLEGEASCVPNSCIVGAIAAPLHGKLGGKCRSGNWIPDGASCDMRCDRGFKLVGLQPTCSAGSLSAGTLACVSDTEQLRLIWIEASGKIYSSSLNGSSADLLLDTEVDYASALLSEGSASTSASSSSSWYATSV